MSDAAPRPVVNDEALYITDNGAVYCGADLGASARFTGRDISGQPIFEITPRVVKQAGEDAKYLVCEACGREPSRLWRPK
jgi:hypothetical protein